MTKDKKIKNLISAVILLGGLFLGSLFVDIAQVFQGGGFSTKNLSKAEVFEAGGKTWVAYQEPIINIEVVNDENCENCDVSEALVWLKRVVPTMSAQKIDLDSEKGQQLVNDFNIKTVPAFIFDQNIEQTDFFAQAQILFSKANDSYLLNTQELGLEPGRYLETPEIDKEGSTVLGATDSNVNLVVFSDFQCPYSKLFHSTLRDVMKDYQDKASFTFKNLPLSFHERAMDAALAGECAAEQGKFWEYADKLFENQSRWSQATGNSDFITYAGQLGINSGQFSECLTSQKYSDKIQEDLYQAQEFSVSGTPGIFVNDKFVSGAIDENKLKELLDSELQQ